MIKISFLRSELHNNKGLDELEAKFLGRIEKIINKKLNFASLSDYDCDLKLILIESGGSEGLFLKNLDKLKEPYYLLTTGDNNSLAASMEILTYLNLNNKLGEILHGDINYIAGRIMELYEINSYKNKLNGTRLGVIGKPSDWLISSIPNYDKIKSLFGIDVIDIKIDELIDLYNKMDYSSFNKDIELEFDEGELNLSKRMYLAIEKLKSKYKLDGLTIRCFDLLSSCKTTSCLAFAILNSEGVVASCEGDIASMLSMVINKLFTKSSFQANPSRIDTAKREIIFAHCTIPLDMLEEYRLDTHYESGIGVAVKGELKTMPVTVFRLSSDLKHYFVAEGEILNNLNEPNLCRTQIRVKFDSDISILLKKPCGNHHIISYGRNGNAIKALLESYGLIEY